MPALNVLKEQVDVSFYHVYARGGNKQKIFLDAADYLYFIKLFERYLSKQRQVGKDGTPYPHFYGKVDLLAYCLMSNHIHLLIFQYEVPNLEKLMRSIMTSYSRYFNLKYERTGPLFESRYKAVRIDDDGYLHHISRYIHLNPRRWEHYRYSSLSYYRDGGEPIWLRTIQILDLFDGSREAYMQFVADYEDVRNILADLKYQLADG